MAKIRLDRSTPITFEYVAPNGEERSVTVPPATIYGLKRALEIDRETPENADPLTRQTAILRQAKALAGKLEYELCFLDEFDGIQIAQFLQAMMAVHAGLSPEGVLHWQREQAKKWISDQAALVPAANPHPHNPR